MILSFKDFKQLSIESNKDENINVGDFVKVNNSGLKYQDMYGIITCDNYVVYNNGKKVHKQIDFGYVSHSYSSIHLTKINYNDK